MKTAPYIWFKSYVCQGPNPFIDIHQLKLNPYNFVGKPEIFNDLTDRQYQELIKYYINTYFITKIIRALDVPSWVTVLAYNSTHCKVKINVEGLIQASKNREISEDTSNRTPSTLVRQVEQYTGQNNVAASLVTEFVCKANNSDRIKMARKKFILTPTDIDWVVRLMRLWNDQYKSYGMKSNPKSFLTNVVGGPRVETKVGNSIKGMFWSSPSKIEITLPKRDIENKSQSYNSNTFTYMLIHEYTHFLQALYINTLDLEAKSFFDSPDFNDLKKYYSSIWERDAYTMEFLYLYLRKQGLPLSVLANGSTLSSHYDPKSFKQFLNSDPQFLFHKKRTDKIDRGDIWTQGIIYSANKFVKDMTPLKFTNEYKIKKMYNADVTSGLSSEDFGIINSNISFSLSKPRWSSSQVNSMCDELGIKNNSVLFQCANIEGMTYHCGLSDAIKSANYLVG